MPNASSCTVPASSCIYKASECEDFGGGSSRRRIRRILSGKKDTTDLLKSKDKKEVKKAIDKLEEIVEEDLIELPEDEKFNEALPEFNNIDLVKSKLSGMKATNKVIKDRLKLITKFVENKKEFKMEQQRLDEELLIMLLLLI